MRTLWLSLHIAILSHCLLESVIKGMLPVIPHIETIEQVASLFPKNPQDILLLVDQAKTDITHALEKIYSIQPHSRTFDNTMRAYDQAITLFGMRSVIISILEIVSPEESIRQTAHEALLQFQTFAIDTIDYNPKLYQAFKEYKAHVNTNALTAEAQYTLEEMLKSFKRSGLELETVDQEKLKILKKQLGDFELKFDRNIATSVRSIKVPVEELKGLSEDFIQQLSKTPENLYILGVDNPTYYYVMDNCSYESTRKALWKEYVNRGYPENEALLGSIITLRDKLAQLLRFKSYAAYDIDDQMASNPETVEKFLNELYQRSYVKATQELYQLRNNLPEGVSLTSDGTFKPWDLLYIYNNYKKKHLAIDEAALSEYFPLDHTISALFEIYQCFFGITFKQITAQGLWSDEVQALQVYKDGILIGTILLDLFPRPHKYTHACEITVVPTFQSTTFYPALVLVIANFPRNTKEKPSLLTRDNVITFFHEFGHALHAVLGTTQLAINSGAQVKRDFVEMPSQMLEQWMWQSDMLKLVSEHYISKETLSQDALDKILSLKNFDIGESLLRQIFYSFLSLYFFKEGSDKDINGLFKSLFQKYMNHMSYEPDNHFYASFGHLVGYGSKYYGYLWSKVYALDLFDMIKQNQFCPEIGQKYLETVIGKGGSADPKLLLRNFLGRDPQTDAFFRDLDI